MCEHTAIPDMEEMLGLRHKNPIAYTFYCEHFLPWVTGFYDYKKQGTAVPPSHWATTSDEAFGLLILEKYWNVWVQEDEREDQGPKRGKNFSGESVARYNELCDLIEEDKSKKENKASFTEFERAFRDKMRDQVKEKPLAMKQMELEDYETTRVKVFDGKTNTKIDLKDL
jgi:hypothetical protein